MTAQLQSLRQRVWGPDDKPDMAAVGEAMRDLHSFCEQLTLTGKVSALNVVWSEPFSFSVVRRPDLVILADARIAGTLTSVARGDIDWQIEGQRVRINRSTTLVPGKSYDLKFLVVY